MIEKRNCLYCNNEFNCNTSHRGKGLFCSRKCGTKNKRKVFIEDWKNDPTNNGLLNSKSTQTSRHIKNYMKETYTECSECGISDWNKKPITLEMDHIDGDATNSRPENLRMLCPNCHSQTLTYGAKNKGKCTRVHHYQTIQK